jgi:hypothetical protein
MRSLMHDHQRQRHDTGFEHQRFTQHAGPNWWQELGTAALQYDYTTQVELHPSEATTVMVPDEGERRLDFTKYRRGLLADIRKRHPHA